MVSIAVPILVIAFVIALVIAILTLANFLHIPLG